MNSPTTAHVDRALAEIQDWKAECRASNLTFYADALAHNELTIVPGKDRTTRGARCDVCRELQKAGMKKFWYSSRRQQSFFWFHPCDSCWNELVQAADIHTLSTCQVTLESGQARPPS